ncbi:TetR/AcrR family transcriptional regulator [Ruania alba]|uniref:DNA-binding transcriptional regulator, AcrR family n=1 Tax=Ruania alba TaxID=648782 RepID=A0A1H5MM72_9MICO|nr:TetR/AcrR family transcriptional regulator [Ruania alba]SEE90404.1 DNA-binding transcriptional regulator, AcrR family [Ruania alba]
MTEPEKSDVAAKTRQRILSAALVAFATDGFDVGLRAIAARAGVTAGLITHYFGSKAKLRQECDDLILARVEQGLPQVFDATGLQQRLDEDSDDLVHSVHYCMKAFAEGGTMCDQLLAVTIAHTREMIATGVAGHLLEPSGDEDVRALMVVRFAVGVAVLDFALDPPKDAAAVADFMDHYWHQVVLPMARTTNGAQFETEPGRGGSCSEPRSGGSHRSAGARGLR